MRTRSKVFIGVGALVAIGATALWYRAAQDKAPQAELVRVQRGTLVSIVNVTGHAEPPERISLAFPVSGTLANVFVEEGDTVEAGAPVALLTDSGESGRVGELEARLSRERAALRDLMAGATGETRAAADAARERAVVARNRAEEELRRALERAYALAHSAVLEGADAVFSNGQGAHPRFGIDFESGSTEYAIRADRETTLALTEGRTRATDELALLASISSFSSGDLRRGAEDARRALRSLSDFMTLLSSTLQRYVPTDAAAQTVYRGFQAPVSAARTSLTTALTSLESAITAHDGAAAALTAAERDAAVTVAPARTGAVEAQQALVAAAEQVLRSALSGTSDRSVRTPVAGTITNVTKRAGEVAVAGSAVAELVTSGTYELETYVPEADIAGIALGNSASVTFDAFDRADVFTAEVVRIALGETVREGVPTYKTTLIVTRAPEGEFGIRPGMTADIDIETARRDEVLYVPTRSVLSQGPRQYVRVAREDGAGYEERTVTTGLRSSEGTIEITSGLNEGEEVVLFLDEE